MKNQALEMFLNSIDKKIDESNKVNQTLSNLWRLTEIIDMRNKLHADISNLISSISNNCVYNTEKLIKIRRNVISIYSELESLNKEFENIKNSIPKNDKYFSLVNTNFDVRKNMRYLEEGNLSKVKYFIIKFRYELKNETLYRTNKKNINKNREM